MIVSDTLQALFVQVSLSIIVIVFLDILSFLAIRQPEQKLAKPVWSMASFGPAYPKQYKQVLNSVSNPIGNSCAKKIICRRPLLCRQVIIYEQETHDYRCTTYNEDKVTHQKFFKRPHKSFQALL